MHYIINSDGQFSLMLDEPTTMSYKTVFILYIRIIDPSGAPCNCFLELCELQHGTTGEAISTRLIEVLEELGLTKPILQKRLLGFCTDGASNLHGHVKGALKLFAQKMNQPDLVNFHCMNHKLELGVHDAVSSTGRVSSLRMFLDTLFAFYSRSPRNVRLLAAAFKKLDIEIRKVGKIFDVRWLASSTDQSMQNLNQCLHLPGNYN